MNVDQSRVGTETTKEPSTKDGDLILREIEILALRVPLARIYRGSYYEMAFRSTLICRLHTESGLVGEAWAGDEDEALEQIAAIIENEIRPNLIGTDLRNIERLWQATRPATFDILRDRRLGLVACAAIDAAAWDGLGKHLGEPLWRLWGGYRSSLPMIAIGGYYDLIEIEDEIAELKELGVAGMKFKVGGRGAEVDAERVRRARAAGGEDFILCVDANQGWPASEALRFARLVADVGVRWFEEPCHWDNDRRAMREVKLGAEIPVCAGQSEFAPSGCRDLMMDGAIDVCNFDASWSGGPTEWRRVAGMAAVFGVEMGHHEEPHIAAHLLASIPHGTYVECFHPDRDPIWWNLVANRPKLTGGELRLSEAPGFGWKLDPEFIQEHLVFSKRITV